MTRGLFLLVAFVLLCSFAACQVIDLRQSDFTDGTYLIDQPGHYRLVEDIVFNPNSVDHLGVTFYDAGRPLPTQFSDAGGKYSRAGYSLGFFAAIAIFGDRVTLDLNGYTLSQAPEHALQQRFFSLIELANVPFTPRFGPHDFAGANPVRSATNTVIKNGVLGFNSHHGIHGNGPVNVTIEDIRIRDYDVAAIAINGAVGLKVRRVVSEGNRPDVPIFGVFSAGTFLRPYLNYLLKTGYEGSLRVAGEELSIQDVHSALRQSILNVFEDVVIKQDGKRGGFIDPEAHPSEYALFHNVMGILDGNAFGMVFHQPGAATNEFPTVPEEPGAMVYLEDVRVEDVKARIMEVVSLSIKENVPVIDAIGAVFQVFNRDPAGQYITISNEALESAMYTGNVVANAQAFVAKAALAGAFQGSGLDVSRNEISEEILAWVEATPGSPESMVRSLLDQFPPICNGDAMMHVNKGTVGIRLGGLESVLLKNVVVDGVRNWGSLGSSACPYERTGLSNPESKLPGYQGSQSRGMSIAGCVNVRITDMKMSNVESTGGSAVGIDVFQDSHDITVERSEIDEIHASTRHAMTEYTGPNWEPVALGIRAVETTSRVSTLSLRSDLQLSNAAGGLTEFIQNLSQGGNNLDLLSSSSFSVSGDSSSHTTSAASLVPACLVGIVLALAFLL